LDLPAGFFEIVSVQVTRAKRFLQHPVIADKHAEPSGGIFNIKLIKQMRSKSPGRIGLAADRNSAVSKIRAEEVDSLHDIPPPIPVYYYISPIKVTLTFEVKNTKNTKH
jgi:hypothetical protein